VVRVLTIALFLAMSLTQLGCAGTWDAITSRKFRKDPFNTTYHLWHPEDPMVILRASPPREGDERARAMHRLKEPLANQLTQQDQDEMVDLLARTATKDPSPVLRLAAIDALGRFEDARASGILMIAYQKAHGRADGTPDPVKAESAIQLAGVNARTPSRLSQTPLTGPTGYSPETVEAIRCQSLESLGRTNRPEAVQFLAAVAAGSSRQSAPEGSDDRDVRLAAVRGLAKCRQEESVVALAQVLAAEKGRDTALSGRAHDGLVRLTGKRLPPDPKKWNDVVQAGVTIPPEPNWVQNAIEWVKK
jgi:HEAT repeat protein